ncbi:hypothetical protein J2847_004480 [Azospirillum agricola]|uniref:chemotaxis protein CheW n=1 Tax=Azospirillum agricola TaxID=1720247 RepID=UPI001AE29117|nr:chemotaxis protein CheW [Azospirillum agricola]MBP2231168.1 hypothetical protein [Azospirillum agricola]
MALLDPPVRPAVRATSAALRLTVAGTAWSLPMEAVHAIAEAGEGSASPTPLPLAEPPIEGVAAVEGRPVLQIDLARALAGGPDAPSGTGRILVVAATEAGALALRVEDARWAGAATAPVLDLGTSLPWTGDTVPVAASAPRPCRGADAMLPLLPVHHAGERVALRIDRLDRVERPDSLTPVPGSRDVLLRFGDALLTARPLTGEGAGDAPCALVLRGDAPGEQAALLVERALGVERCPLDRLTALRHSDGVESLWWRREDGEPLRVIDPGPLFGWAATAGGEGRVGEAARWTPPRPARPDVLEVEIAGHAVAFPLALVAGVDEASFAGGPARLRLAGMRRALPVDRLRPLATDGTVGWRSLTALPPSVAPLFDAARWDAAAMRWRFRVNADSLTRIPGNRVAWPAKRALAAARRVWGGGS